jgi:hypothetical protein
MFHLIQDSNGLGRFAISNGKQLQRRFEGKTILQNVGNYVPGNKMKHGFNCIIPTKYTLLITYEY